MIYANPPMTTHQRDEMDRYIRQEANGPTMQDKVRRAYRQGFAAREKEIEELKAEIERWKPKDLDYREKL